MGLLHVLVGGIVGAVVLSVLTVYYHGRFFPKALGDGQYIFIFFGTVPVGAVLGAITGAIIEYCSKGQIGTAGRVAVTGGSLLTMLFLLIGLFLFTGPEKPRWRDRLSSTLFWFGLPLLWSGALLTIGIRLL